MKYFTILFVFMGILFSTNGNAQFKLKKLDNVIVSLGEGQTMKDYTDYLTKYFGRINILEALTEKGNYNLTTVGDKSYLQGSGVNAEQQNVLFRVQVSVSEDGRTITKIDSHYEAQACIAKSCNNCSFNDDSSCACEGEGECELKLWMSR